ncbi:ATP-binding protein [Streptomyces sp. NPDC008121]|uniref:ATP-binding protein n=1 Tax=Streptomyces sp. NPDC008121 TaxID=3364809 RepID=UPI0036E99A74
MNTPTRTEESERLRAVELPTLTRPTRGAELTDAERAWPRRMRTAAAEMLREWGLSDLASDVQVVVSELVTNAVLHTSARQIAVRMSLHTETIRIEVEACAATRSPARCAPGPDQEHGRGLLIVEELASRWGTDKVGEVVWCEIDYKVTTPVHPAQQVLTFERHSLPAGAPTVSGTARTFVRYLATARGWKGNVEEAARVIGMAATLSRSTQLGLAIGQNGALHVEIEDKQPESTRADQVLANVFHCVTGAELQWSRTPTGRVARAALPVQHVERIGGAA